MVRLAVLAMVPTLAAAHPEPTPPDSGPDLAIVPQNYACLGLTRDARGVLFRAEYLDQHGHVVYRAYRHGDRWQVRDTSHYLHVGGGDEETVFWALDRGGDGTVDQSGHVRLSRWTVTESSFSNGASRPAQVDRWVFAGKLTEPTQRHLPMITFSKEPHIDPLSVETFVWAEDRTSFVHRFYAAGASSPGAWLEHTYELSDGRVTRAAGVAYTWRPTGDIATRFADEEGGQRTTYEPVRDGARCTLFEARPPWQRY